MKKITFLICGMLLGLAIPQTASAQVEKGTVLIDAYYGFPNLYSAVFRAAYNNSGYTDYKVTGSGPFGIRGEYLLTDKFGIGLDVGYNATKIQFTETDETSYDPNTGQYLTTTYHYKYTTSKLGVMATFNFHFVETEHIDFYGVVGAGYGNRQFTFTSDDPYDNASAASLIPIAFKTGVGLRYFFTDNIGANVAVQVGQGGIINGGLSFKF